MSEISKLHELFLQHPNISTDTRKVEKDSIFFALKGDNFNGNLFSKEAFSAGATYAVVDEENAVVNDECILVEDVLTTLQQLALYHRRTFDIPFIGITGSNGKTTTKELLDKVLSQKFNVLSTIGNLNNHIGVPLTLLRLNKSHEMAIIEMGANHVGEIGFLCGISEPDYGLITNIGSAHLKGFGSLEGVVKAKTELYHFIEKSNGTLFVNEDDELLMSHSSNIDRILYGKSFQNHEVSYSFGHTGKLNVKISDLNKVISSKLFGAYNFYNIMAATVIGSHFDIPFNAIVQAIEDYTPKNNRSQIIKTDKNQLILDAYNANPSSVKQVLSSFKEIDHPKKIVILGDMLELGEDSNMEHQKILDSLNNMELERIYLVGDIYYSIDSPTGLSFKDNLELSNHLKSNPPSDALILIKGSRGIALEKCVDVIP